MKHNAGLAQLVEQLTSNLRVAGSIPALGAIFSTAALSLALVLPGAAEAKQPSRAEKASAHASKSKPKKATASRTQAKPAPKTASTKAKAKPKAEASAPPTKKSQKSRSKAKTKAEVVEPERPAKKTRSSHSKSAPVTEKRVAAEAAAPTEPKRVVVLEKADPPVRTEQGCLGENGTLAAVGQVMRAGAKTFRCQKTWDYNEGKLVGYPAWVELFMPTPGWGAGLKETPRPPADAVLPVPGAKAKVAPLADKQPAVPEEDEPSSSGVQNQLY
jgi:hypothetical protein